MTICTLTTFFGDFFFKNPILSKPYEREREKLTHLNQHITKTVETKCQCTYTYKLVSSIIRNNLRNGRKRRRRERGVNFISQRHNYPQFILLIKTTTVTERNMKPMNIFKCCSVFANPQLLYTIPSI